LNYLKFLKELAGKLPDNLGQLTAESWLTYTDQFKIPRNCVIAVANKADIPTSERSFSYLDLIRFVDRNKLQASVETSAKTSLNVDLAFSYLGAAARLKQSYRKD